MAATTSLNPNFLFRKVVGLSRQILRAMSGHCSVSRRANIRSLLVLTCRRDWPADDVYIDIDIDASSVAVVRPHLHNAVFCHVLFLRRKES